MVGSGDIRFGDRRIVLAHAGSIIPSTGIAGIITPVDGIITKAPGCGEYRQAAGAGASKVIYVPVPTSAFGGKADIN